MSLFGFLLANRNEMEAEREGKKNGVGLMKLLSRRLVTFHFNFMSFFVTQ